MTGDEIRTLVLRVIGDIAPDADLSLLLPTADIRDALDLDSMDILNVVIALGEQTGVEIPERDYADVTTLDGCVAYLLEHGAGDV